MEFDILIDYLNFVGSGLYLASFVMFLFLFIKTMRVKDGIGLTFLRVLTICLSIGSLVIFAVRMCTVYGNMDMDTSRAIATFNPLLMLCVGLYLNFLFNNARQKLTDTDSKNITQIKSDVNEVKKDVKVVKNEVMK